MWELNGNYHSLENVHCWSLYVGKDYISDVNTFGPFKVTEKFCHEILETLSYHNGKNPKSLSHLVLERYRVVTPRQTDRQTDRQNYHS